MQLTEECDKCGICYRHAALDAQRGQGTYGDNKRKAEECAEENKKRRSKEGYSPGFIITVDADAIEQRE